MLLKIIVAIAMQCFLCVSFASASEWTVDDLVLHEQAQAWAISRDASLAAFVKSTVVKVEGEEQRVSNLWLARLDREDTRALTRGNKQVSAPAFSPDSATDRPCLNNSRIRKPFPKPRRMVFIFDVSAQARSHKKCHIWFYK